MRYVSLLLLSCGCGTTPASMSPTSDASSVDAPNVVSDAGTMTMDTFVPRDCSRAANAHTAPVALYDALVSDLASLTGAARDKRIDTFLDQVRAQGGAPLEDPKSNRVVFVVRGAPPSGPWSIAGSFTNWKSGALPMQTIAPDLFVLDAKIDGTHQYKLLSGTDDSGFREDPLATNVVWDGIDHQTVGEFNAIVHERDASLSKGRLQRLPKVHATKLGDDRDVFVYFPGSYDDGSCKDFPLVVFHDGNESLTRSDFAGVADAWYAQTPSDAAVLAFVALPSQNVRMDQYTFGTQTAKGDLYVDFLVSDLLPKLRALNTCKAQGALGISGASLGGLISTYAAFEKPDVFGFVGSQSGSFFWNNEALAVRAKTTPKMSVRFYLDHGCPNDNCDSNRNLYDVLVQKGYDTMHVEDPNAQHDWSFWKKRLPKLLHDFRDGQTVCN